MGNYKELFDELKKYSGDQYLDEFIRLLSRILFSRSTFVQNSDNEELRSEFYSFLKSKIKEFSNEYSTDFNSISYLGEGHTSLAFKMGDNVIKIGKSSNHSLIDRYQHLEGLIPVYTHFDFKVGSREYYFIQFSPYVEMVDFSEEDLYDAYKKIRVNGYIWNDPTSDNMGRMVNDFDFNGHHYNKGDVVILDLEDLAYVGEEVSDEVLDEIAISSYNGKVYRFETRYISEKETQKMNK